VSLSERIVDIVARLRARLLAARAAEAAGVGAAVGGLAAALMMGARILQPVYPAPAALLAGAPLAPAAVLAASPRLRRRVGSSRLLQACVLGLLALCGAGGLALAATGALAAVGKNWLFAIAPGGAAVGAAVVLARGVSLSSAAADVDRRAALKDRLATALELCESGDESLFARQVRRQVLDARRRRAWRGMRFWNRTRATAAAATLALLAAAVMLPVEPLESSSARRQRQWVRLAPAAGRALAEGLAALGPDAASGNAAEALGRLEALAGALRQARPAEAEGWQGKVIELDRLAEALREAVASGRLDPATAARLRRVIDVVEKAAADLAEGMSGPSEALAAVPPPPATAPSASPPAGWTGVYNPAYAEVARTRPAEAAPETAPAAVPAALPFDRQWAAARRRAADALRARAVPPEYRRLVRDFFEAGD